MSKTEKATREYLETLSKDQVINLYCKNSLKRKTQSNRDLQRLKHSVNTQFVISQLEEIKEMLSTEYKRYPIVYDKTDDLVGGALDREKVFEIIEQQISKIKGDGNEK